MENKRMGLFTVAIMNSAVGVFILGVCCLFSDNWDPTVQTTALLIFGTAIGLAVVEFLCWLFHIPEWTIRAIRWIHKKSDPKKR